MKNHRPSSISRINEQQDARPQVRASSTILLEGVQYGSFLDVLEAILRHKVTVELPARLYDPATHEYSTLKQSPSLGLLYREF